MSRARIFDFSKPLENISTLLLDNGVASLAASILEDGHQVDVVDHGNLGLMGYFEPPAALADELRSMEQALTAAPSSAASQAELAGGARRAANEMKAFHRERVDHLAAADAAAVLEDGVDAVLVKAWNGLGMYYFQRLAREVKALAAREHRPVRVLGGGPAVNWLGEHVLRRVEHADAVQFGEGEAAVKLLLRLPATEAGFAQVPGLIFRAGEQIVSNPPQWEPDLDRLALPVYEPSVYRAHQGDLKIKIAMVDDSRGCPNKCFFCAHYHESGEQWRCKSPRRVVDEMEALASKFGIRYFRYAGSSTPPGLRAQIAREILRRDLKVRYCAFINTNTVGEGDMELLKESGCFGVFFGIESINEALARRSLGTKNTRQGIEFAIRSAKAAGIYTVGSIIIPAPFETDQTMDETIGFLSSSGIDAVPVGPPALSGTGSQWAREQARFGFDTDADWIERALDYDINLNLPLPMWEPFPYRLNGRPPQELMRLAGEAARRLRQAGIPQVSDEVAMMARILGEEPGKFCVEAQFELKRGEHEKMAKRVATLNERIKSGALI